MADKTARSRSKAACQFCRARKLKCDNEEPECSACKARRIRCEYVIRAPAPRPSNAAIHALREENRRLRGVLRRNGLLDARAKGEDGDEGDGDGDVMEEEADGEVEEKVGKREAGEAVMAASPSSVGAAGAETAGEGARPQSAAKAQHFDPMLDAATAGAGTTPSALGPARMHVGMAAFASTGYQQQQQQQQQQHHHHHHHHYGHDHDHISPRWQESRQIDPVASTLDENTKTVLRSQLVAFSARQRQIEALPLTSQGYDFDGWDPDLVLHLLNIHWNRQHHNLLIIYRPLFMRDWASGGPYFSKLLLNAILFATAKFSPREDLRKSAKDAASAGFLFRQRFKKLLGEEMDDSKVTTIQALITVASSLFAIETSAKSTAWLYSGIAFRMIIDLNLNADGVDALKKNKISAEELECRRRVFWGAFVFDKIHSMYYGRPVTLQESSVQVPVEFLDDYEELEQWYPLEPLNRLQSDYPLPPHPGGPSYSVTTFSAHCRISVILGRILTEFYVENVYCHRAHVATTQQPNQVQTMLVLDELLAKFVNELPNEIRYEPWSTGEPLSLHTTPTPTVLSMLCMYHLCVILLHRPFLTKGHLYDENQAAASLLKCAYTAMRVSSLVQIYKHAFTGRRMPYFIAYSAYVAITILLRVNAFLEPGSEVSRRLHRCLEVLRESERINSGVKRASFVITKLLSAIARVGPNPFPPTDSLPPPWGETVTDNVHLDHTRIARIIDTFTSSSPDAVAEQSQLEVHPSDATFSTAPHAESTSVSHSGISTPWELNDGTAAQLLTSLRTNTPAATPKPPLAPMHAAIPEPVAPFPDIIFGLHSDEAFQGWPDFNNDLEAMLWMPGLITNGPPGAG